MYSNVSEDFDRIIRSSSRMIEAELINGETVFKDEILEAELFRSGNSGSSITIGSCVSSYLTIELSGNINDIENHELQYSMGVAIDSNTTELIPMGYFTASAEDIEKTDTGIKLTAYDRMKKLEVPYVGKSVTYTDILNEISEQTGVPIDIPQNDYSFDYSPTGTCKSIVGIIASKLGKFAIIDREGSLIFRWYSVIQYDITNDRYFEYVKSENNYVVEFVKCITGDNEEIVVGSGSNGITYTDAYATQEDVGKVYLANLGMTYLPGKINYTGDMRIDPGDIVQIEGNNLNCMNITDIYDGGYTSVIEAVGSSEYSGPTQESINALKKKILTIEKTEEGIRTEVKEIKTDFNNLEIGGRNLIQETTDTATKYTMGNWNKLYKKVEIRDVGLIIGDYVTFSAYLESAGEDYVDNICTRIDQYDSSATRLAATNGNFVKNSIGGWSSVTVQIKDSCSYINLIFGRQNGSSSATTFEFESKKEKLEKGNKQTDWTPAPEDVQTDIKEVYSLYEQTSQEIVLKVDASGRIVQVALGTDAEEGSVFKVDADNIKLTATDVIDILSGGTLNLTGKKIEIKSDNFNVDKYGNVLCKSLIMERGSGEDYLKIIIDDDEGFVAYGGEINGSSRKIVDFSTNKSTGGVPIPWFADLMIDGAISKSGSGADKTYINFSQSLIRANTFEGTLDGTAENANNVHVVNDTTNTVYLLGTSSYDTGNQEVKTRPYAKVSQSEGTESVVGICSLSLGNNVESGTSGNSIGYVTIYGDKKYFGRLQAVSGYTSNRNYYLPNKSGTVALTTDVMVTETIYVSSFANSTGYVDVTVSNGYKTRTLQITPVVTSSTTEYLTQYAIQELSATAGTFRIKGVCTSSGKAVAFNVCYKTA